MSLTSCALCSAVAAYAFLYWFQSFIKSWARESGSIYKFIEISTPNHIFCTRTQCKFVQIWPNGCKGQENLTLLCLAIRLDIIATFLRALVVQFTTVSTTVAAEYNARSTASNFICLPLVLKCSNSVSSNGNQPLDCQSKPALITTCLLEPTSQDLTAGRLGRQATTCIALFRQRFQAER